MTNSRADIQKFIVDCRAEENRQREFSDTEQKLWDLAEASPFEQTRIITTNEKVLADPYLMRVYLAPQREELEAQLSMLGVPPAYARYIQYMPRPYLHYFFRGDDDRAYHNHPWKRSLSLILIGGYIEHVWNFELKRPLARLFTPGKVNYLKRGTYHRAELLPGKKTWTLFVSSGRVQASDGFDWEFYDPDTDTFTPHGQWTNDRAKHRPFSTVARVGDRVTVGGPDERAAAKMEQVLDRPRATPADDPHAGHGGYDWASVNGQRF